MLTYYRSLRPLMTRGAVTVLTVSLFLAVAAAGVAQAQTIYYDFSNATPSMDMGTVCTTTTYVDGYGNAGSYVTCRRSYTIPYDTPGYEKYYFYNP